ncbi:MAG: aminotransferase class-III, partial [Friedmanniella sp.]|nr:aminotransferase class-III [Friedmanniella sp.]
MTSRPTDPLPAYVCRSCRTAGRAADDLVLDLGSAPAGDAFPRPGDPRPDPAFPLSLWCCPGCGLAQLTADETRTEEPRAVEPQALRRQATDAVQRVLASGVLDGVDRTAREFPSPHGGSWLDDLGWPVTTEPAGVVLDSFGLMHEPDQAAAIAGRAAALVAGGVLLVQFHSLEAIVAGGQWNALRHGHYAYFSLTSLTALLGRAGLEPVRVWEFDLYGLTVLVAARRTGEAVPHPSVAAVSARETGLGLTRPEVLRGLQRSADQETDALGHQLRAAAALGERVFAYGAASRAVALLDRAGVDADLLLGVADASPAKQGRTLPSTATGPGDRIPIISPEQLVAERPDRVLLLLPDLLPEVAAGYPSLADRLTVALGPSPVPGAPPSFARSQALQQRLHELVPSGAHTYARGPDQYPEGMAPVLTHGSGARVWDVDGNCFVEYGMGLRAVTLGHGYRPVVEAVARAASLGTSFSRPTHLEVAAAEDLLGLLPGADMVKFAKNGSDATTAALKLARAATGRTVVAIADQPFFSVDDWFIQTTPMSAGIPAGQAGMTDRFAYNDLESLTALFDRHDGRVAAVFLEAATAMAEPQPGYLQAVRALCDRHGTVLVFDEMITGFRWAAGGAQQVYGVTPDLSCWGKAMGNGFPVSALAGRRSLMELGGLRTDRERTFLLSTTHGPETTGLAAFRAVVRAYREGDPVGAMESAGRQLAAAVGEVVAEAGLGAYVDTSGRPSCLVYRTRDAQGHPSQAFRTIFMTGLLNHGVLGQSFLVSAAHTTADLELTVTAVRAALVDYARALTDGPA